MSYEWRNVLIRPDQPIRDALELIDKESLRIALVIDNNFLLLGVITDGDIRRGLLNNLNLESPVSKVMNINPITAKAGTSRRDLLDFMSKEKLLAIPLVEDGIICGLEAFQTETVISKYENPVFIMAGGFGSRLKPLTDNCPKPLLKIGKKPILEIVLKRFIEAGFVNFYISTHYLPEMISNYFGDGSKWNINIHYVHEESPLGTGGALGLLPSDISNLPLILINGDVLTNVDFEKLLKFHVKNNASATMCVREYEYQVPYGVIDGQNSIVKSMEEKPIQRFFVNAGVYIISSEVRKSVVKYQHIDMPSVLENFLDDSAKVMMFPIYEYWLDIGSMEDYLRAQNDILHIDF